MISDNLRGRQAPRPSFPSSAWERTAAKLRFAPSTCSEHVLGQACGQVREAELPGSAVPSRAWDRKGSGGFQPPFLSSSRGGWKPPLPTKNSRPQSLGPRKDTERAMILLVPDDVSTRATNGALRVFPTTRGHCRPFGATPMPGGVNFAVFSRHAHSVYLVLFQPGHEEPIAEIALDPTIHKT